MSKKISPKQPSKNQPKPAPKSFPTRPPIVTLLGHVDHGKTSILDVIRQTHLQSKEAGGITQSIGAYQVQHKGQKITFIDTPGHAAFTAMRARGGKAADLVVLVVAADDGVMPQTIEAISHAKAAKAPIVVVLNKIDLPGAKAQRALQQLSKHGVVTEKLGGEVVAVEVSAKTGQGVEGLLEMIILSAEMLEIKSDPAANPAGMVLEGHLDKRQGVIASLVVKEGVLRLDQTISTGTTYGKIKSMVDWQGKAMKEALPSTPLQVLGLKEVPLAGEKFAVVTSEKEAQKLDTKSIGVAAKRQTTQVGDAVEKTKAVDAQTEELEALKLIIKADSQGSLQAVVHSLEGLQSDEAGLEYIHQGVGNIGEADIMLAAASGAIILGFRVEADRAAENAAKLEKVVFRTYDIIYRLIEEVEDALEGQTAEPEVTRLGLAKVLEVFVLSDKTRVAGCQVEEGRLARGHRVRIIRGDEVIGQARILSLRVGKERVDKIEKGKECGISLKGEVEFTKGDFIESIQE